MESENMSFPSYAPRVGVNTPGAPDLESIELSHCLGKVIATEGFITWFVGVPVCYTFSIMVFTRLGWWKGEKSVRGEMKMTHLMSFMLVSLICCIYISVAGLMLYLGLFGVDEQYTILMHNKFYARSTFVERHLLTPMFCYQVWNTLNCFLYNELFSPMMIMHHAATCMLQVLGFLPFLHSECFFFIGIAEITNLPLTWMDVCKAKPEWKERWPNAYSLNQLVFAIAFLSIRVVIWPMRAIPVWWELGGLLAAGQVRNETVAYGFIAISSVLSVMQVMWGHKIASIALYNIKLLLAGPSEPPKPTKKKVA